MKHSLFLALTLWIGVTLSAQENRWSFFESLDWESRLAFIQDQPSAQTDGEFLLKALSLADSERIESGTDLEINNKKAITQIAMKYLADHPLPGAAVAVARIAQQYRDPLLRGEAWVALAKMGDRDSAPGMVRILASINESGLRSRAEEIQAAYLVQALGLLEAPEAFRTMWATSMAWYSPASGVRAQARRTLAVLVPDGEKATLELLAQDEDLGLREDVFHAIVDQGDAVATGRASTALLSTLVRLQPRDQSDQERTARLILEALVAAQKAATPPVELVPSLRILLTKGGNSEEATQTVRLLGKIDEPSALSLLTSTLAGYNARQKAGTNKAPDLLLVKELIAALLATGKAAARVPLDEARFSDYTPAIVREAQDALDKLPKN